MTTTKSFVHHSPQTNGVVERFFETVKYEHLYREEIENGHALALEVKRFRVMFNEIRPHERLDFERPMDAYLRPPESTYFQQKVSNKVDSGHLEI